VGRSERRQALHGLVAGYFGLLVGTHAVLEEGVEIPRLGLAVIDERHKFGVEQRARLEAKGRHPDMLMLTATPLPRALVLTQYGDTSLSLLDEAPPGRGGTATTWHHGAAGRDEAYRFVAGHLAAGERAFAVFPLVEESDHLLLRDASREYERLAGRFPGVRAALIHGRMSADEKEDAMAAFGRGDVSLLVATTVIEVGIDVPEATAMLVEHADRFGLSQLHQLRGRVGRGARPSRCLLVTTGRISAEARARLETMVRVADGFRLAEEDLKLRGPGEMFGTRQHGLADEGGLDPYDDLEELEAAREEAGRLLEADPGLETPEGLAVRRALGARRSPVWDLVRAS
jgi:ATP-dependent DNA helicase RecG